MTPRQHPAAPRPPQHALRTRPLWRQGAVTLLAAALLVARPTWSAHAQAPQPTTNAPAPAAPSVSVAPAGPPGSALPPEQVAAALDAHAKLAEAASQLAAVDHVAASTRRQLRTARRHLDAATTAAREATRAELRATLTLATVGYRAQTGAVALAGIVRSQYTTSAGPDFLNAYQWLFDQDPAALSAAATAQQANTLVTQTRSRAVAELDRNQQVAATAATRAERATWRRTQTAAAAAATLKRTARLAQRLHAVRHTLGQLADVRSQLAEAAPDHDAATAGTPQALEQHADALQQRVADAVNRLPSSVRTLLAPTADTTFYRPGTGGVTSPFGMRFHPILHVVKLHSGTDFAVGDGLVYASAPGIVSSTTTSAAWGNLTIISHGSSPAGPVETWYAHQSQFLVHPGDYVATGDVIGVIGATGYATGPHLHFEIHVNGVPIDPMTILSAKTAHDRATADAHHHRTAAHPTR